MYETRICKVSGKVFGVAEKDRLFLEAISPVVLNKRYDLPLPILCPEERQRGRL